MDKELTASIAEIAVATTITVIGVMVINKIAKRAFKTILATRPV